MRLGRAITLTVSWLLAVLPASGVEGVGRSPAPSYQEVMADLGFDSVARRDVLSGKIVVTELAATSESELSVAAAMIVPASWEAVYDVFLAGADMRADPRVRGIGELGDGPRFQEGFGPLRFEDGEKRESPYFEAPP